MTEPKMRQLQLTAGECKNRLTETNINGVRVRFKLKSDGWYGGYGYNSAFTKFNLEDGTIKAQVVNPSRYSFTYYTKAQLDEFLAWAKKNAVWHSLKVKRALNSNKTVPLGEDFSVPDPDVNDFRYTIHGAVHLPITDKQRKDIQAILDTRKEAAAKKKKALAEAKKKQAAAQKKQAMYDDALLESDIAVALAILKKRGLKVVTVDQDTKKKK